MREAVRNRLLRRVDWRFLLPDPRPNRVVSFVSGELAAALELISGQVVPADHGAPNTSDLAVVGDPDRATLRRAWEGLRPGGSVYAEWSSAGAGGTRAIRRRLLAAGFHAIRFYWPWPAVDRCQAWLPLETAAPLDYYFLRHRPPPRSPALRLRRAARYAEARLRGVMALRLPVCTVAMKPEREAPSRGAAADGRPDLPGRTAGTAHGAHAAEPFHYLLLTRGPRTISKVVALVFGRSDRQPRSVVKIARVPEAVPGLCREAEVLQELERGSGGGIPGVPRVIRIEHGTEWLAVGESAVLGAPVWSVMRHGSYRELALQATDWLATLAVQTGAEPTSLKERVIEPVLSEFADWFEPVVDAAMWRVTAEAAREIGPPRAVCEQRDFSPWNVFLTRERGLGVLDWESAELRGLPALDLLYFLAYLGFFHDGAMQTGAFERSYRAGLDPSTFTGAVRAECLSRYAGLTGLEPAALRALRLFLWPLHARSEYRHFAADVAGTPTPEALRRSLFLRLWREEVLAASSR